MNRIAQWSALALATMAGCGSTPEGVGASDPPTPVARDTGDTCIGDYWFDAGNTQKLTCTANDVTVTTATIVSVDGVPVTADHPATCTLHGTFSFVAQFTVPLTAQTRYDVGLYFSTDGGGTDGALTGLCSGHIITPSSGGLGSTDFVNLDASPDTCGDIDSAHNPQLVTVEVNNVACEDTDGNGKLNLPNCVSWRQPGSNAECDGIRDAYPGSPSKCNCNPNFEVPITVVAGSVAKSFQGLACATVTYGVTVTNTGNADLTLTDLVDIAGSDANDCTTCGGFGNLLAVQGDVVSTTCADNTVIHPGSANAYSCSFNGEFCDAASNSDKIRATLSGGGTTLTEVSPEVTVYVSASTTPP